jgi:two-component system chemotaxis response regulator CheB
MTSDSKRKIKVMLVDDSAVIRGFIGKILESDPEIEVVSSCQNGQMAVAAVAKTQPDIIILDVEMPVMDGITAIPLLLQNYPAAKIVMCSTITTQNGATTLKAMSLGAVDCIAKPSSTQEIYGQDEFKAILLSKIKLITNPVDRKIPADEREETPTKKVALHPHLPKTVTLRPAHEGWNGKPSILAIGSSTGGPNALFKVLSHCTGFDIPIVITQHMPPTFTKILAEHIQNQTGVPCFEADEGMTLEPGKAYVARGGVHMLLKEDKTLKLSDGPMENFCRPAVDPMLRSLIPIYKEKILSVILTGMGHDGMQGARDVVKAGGRVIAQDEASSVVWGMPGAVALAGLCSAILPLNDIGPAIRKAVLRL